MVRQALWVRRKDGIDFERLLEPRTGKRVKEYCLQKEQAIKLEKKL